MSRLSLIQESNPIDDLLRVENFICRLCGLLFSEQKDLTDHSNFCFDLQNPDDRLCADPVTVKCERDNDPIDGLVRVEKFICRLCGLVFSEQKDLTDHSNFCFDIQNPDDRLCADPVPVKCERDNDPIDGFVRVEKFICRLCRFVFSEQKDLTDHSNFCFDIQNPDDRLCADPVTVKCERDNDPIDDLVRVEKFICRLCGLVFSEQKDLTDHSKFCFDIQNPDDRLCADPVTVKCERDNDPIDDLVRVEKFICRLCRFVFSEQKDLTDHSNFCFDIQNPDDRLCADPVTVKYERDNDEYQIPEFLGVHNETKPIFDVKLEQIVFTEYTISDHPSTISGRSNAHPQIETLKELFECSNCNYKAPEVTQLQEHMKVHIEDTSPRTTKIFKCSLCDYACKQTTTLTVHMRSHTGEKPFKCTMCGFTCAQASSLRRHKKTHTGEKPLKCTLCDYASANSTTLKRHMRTHTGEKPFKCTLCGYASAQNGALTTHMRSHTGEKVCKCTLCDYTASHTGALTEHMRVHTSEKPFKCTMCDFTSTRHSHLKLHIRSHTGEKPFKCTLCDYAFSRSTELNCHMRTHTGDKPFKCTICESAFAQCATLTVHMRKHTGEKPFKCTICESAFAQCANLTVHMRRHTGHKPFKCTICDSAFSQRGTLTVHMRSHTGEKPFKCTICSFASARQRNLKAHLKRHAEEKRFT